MMSQIQSVIFVLFFAFPILAFAGPVDFVRDVRPIFQKHCYQCHGETKQKAELRLDIRELALKGGNRHGPDIIPGEAANSPLIHLVTSRDADEGMPTEGDRLSASQIATLKLWIDQGAKWPEGSDLFQLRDLRDHWSFKPLQDPEVPETANQTWPRNNVDRFILSQLETAGLEPSGEAGRSTWIRRVTFDLTGLPPTPERVESFLQNTSPDAYETVVDELLASPRYGERWAQHWLDVVRYADTNGFEVNTPRPHAWPYRDYVIAAFNHDTPYDQFIREQLAGDTMGKDAATGFLVTSAVLLPGQIGKDEASKRLARQDELGEIIINTGEAFLGLSIGCARCHDHKFDPITSHDYYSMEAFFSGVRYGDRQIHSDQADAAREEANNLTDRVAEIDNALANLAPLAKTGVQRSPVNARLNIERFAPVKAKRVRFTIQNTNNLEPCLDELEVFDLAGRNVALASEGTRASASGSIVVANRHELEHINDGRYGNSHSWMSNQKGGGWVMLEFAAEHTIERIVWGRDREGKFSDRLPVEYSVEVADARGNWQTVADSTDRKKYDPKIKKSGSFALEGLNAEQTKQAKLLQKKKKSLNARITDLKDSALVYGGVFQKPEPIFLLAHGDPEQPKGEVEPATIHFLGTVKLPKDSPDEERRRELANWIASPDNPLTARVMVNRIWQGHFGIGLVETSNDFGHSGTLPSHPELLDWLATEFIRGDWSIKKMQRLIVLSSTYRQSSLIRPDAQMKDASDRLLWRFPARRREAESIRDSMLAVSGRLNLKTGGPGFDLFRSRGGLSGFPAIESFSGEGLRRMIYAHKIRMEREGVFGAFDCPDAGQTVSRRTQSTTALQALNLFNSQFTVDEATAMANRVRREIGKHPKEQVRLSYQLAYGREPGPDELAEAVSMTRDCGLTALCRAIYNSSEFLFLP